MAHPFERRVADVHLSKSYVSFCSQCLDCSLSALARCIFDKMGISLKPLEETVLFCTLIKKFEACFCTLKCRRALADLFSPTGT